MIDLRKINDSPLVISGSATMADLNTAMLERRNMIDALQSVFAAQLDKQPLSPEVLHRLGEAAELLNNEVDALEQVTLLH